MSGAVGHPCIKDGQSMPLPASEAHSALLTGETVQEYHARHAPASNKNHTL